MIWDHKKPHYIWICREPECPRYDTEWMEQENEARCQHCGHHRRYVGCFSAGKHEQRGKRFNLDTQKWEYIRSTVATGTGSSWRKKTFPGKAA